MSYEDIIEQIEACKTLKELGALWVKLYPGCSSNQDICKAVADKERELKNGN